MAWLDKLTRRWKRTPGDGDRSLPTTPPDQWTVSGIRFDTSGWKLVDSSSTTMSWSAPNATLVLSRKDLSVESVPVPLVEYRNRHRTEARARGDDVVLLEIVRVRQGEVVNAVYKRPSGLGYRYRGLIEVHQGTQGFRIESDIDEGAMTGTREAMVGAMRASCGEFAVGRQNPDGSHQVQGLLIDAYDPAFDEGATNALNDDERLDVLFPTHPLSRIRAALRVIVASLELEDGAVASAPARHDGAMSGPRRQLSLPVLRGLFAEADRFDLVEQSLQEELATLGDVPSLELATGLMQAGIYLHLHMKARPVNAVPMLARAESMFVQLAGDDSPQAVLARTHHAIALFKVGRNGQALPLLLRAISVMETTPVDDQTYTLALANAAQLLAHNGDRELAAEYLERARMRMARIRR